MKILYVCNDFDYFRAHRWFLAQAMIDKGCQVVLSTGGVQISKSRNLESDVKIIEVEVDRHKLNLVSDFDLLISYIKQLKDENVDVVHAITIKPILFMGIALLINKLLLRKTPKFILTYPGLGKVFETDKSIKATLRRFAVSLGLWVPNFLLKPHATFENHSNLKELMKARLASSDRASVVMGAGIDRSIFYSAKREGEIVVLFASRLLKAKGLRDFIEAAATLKDKFSQVRFQVAGKQELDNPDSFQISDLISANEAGVIEYIGEIEPNEMPESLRKSDILVAPSKLQEGLPRVVLEAASCGCCIIASDHEMLQRFVIENETGWLLKEVSSKTIEEKLQIALSDTDKTRTMGKLVAKKMSELPIFEDNLVMHFEKLYRG